jgi:hypothetical protein
MPAKQYKTYSNIRVTGNEFYIGAVMRQLNKIAATTDGRQFIDELNRIGQKVTVQQTTGRGNSCRAESAHCSPLLLQYVKTGNQIGFRNELKAAIGQAKRRGITLEHLGRQLSMGLSPATYRATRNVVRPSPKIAMPLGATPAQTTALFANKAMQSMGKLEELMDGRQSVTQLPQGWDVDLARLLRDHLTPGRGCATTVKFDPADSKPCSLDPAMRNRPPALGLVHELIHAWHNATGRSMRLARTGNEKLEEVITTGLPPYNFERFSDNKFRALWTENPVELRGRY